MPMAGPSALLMFLARKVVPTPRRRAFATARRGDATRRDGARRRNRYIDIRASQRIVDVIKTITIRVTYIMQCAPMCGVWCMWCLSLVHI